MSFLDTKTVEPLGNDPTPAAWKLSDAEAIGIQTIKATFDGSGAAGSFLPTVVFLAPDGKEIARCPTDTAVTAGDSAEVTFAPFLRSAAGAAPSSGIQFDTDNVGGWLQVETTSDNPSNIPIGIELHSEGVLGGMLLHTDFQPLQITGGGDLNHGGVQILSNGNGLTILYDSPSATPMVIDSFQRQEIDIASSNSQSGNVNICGDPLSVGNSLSFFQSGGVGQQTLPAVPTTAQIRAVLVAFGLVAP